MGGVLLFCLRLFCSLTSRIKPANSGLDVSALMLCICADEEVTVTFLSEVSATEVPERSKQNEVNRITVVLLKSDLIH